MRMATGRTLSAHTYGTSFPPDRGARFGVSLPPRVCRDNQPAKNQAAPTNDRLRLSQVSLSRVAHAKSKRSRFITLVQAATKSWTNFCWASELP